MPKQREKRVPADGDEALRVRHVLQRLKDARFQGNETDLANAIGVQQSTIWRQLHGETGPSMPTAKKIAAFLGVSVAELLGMTTSPPSVDDLVRAVLEPTPTTPPTHSETRPKESAEHKAKHSPPSIRPIPANDVIPEDIEDLLLELAREPNAPDYRRKHILAAGLFLRDFMPDFKPGMTFRKLAEKALRAAWDLPKPSPSDIQKMIILRSLETEEEQAASPAAAYMEKQRAKAEKRGVAPPGGPKKGHKEGT